MSAFIVIATLLMWISSVQGQTGYFCVPVADLVAEPFDFSVKEHIQNAYESLTISPEQGKKSCLRVHQGIFNESVTILAYKKDQVQIILNNCVSKAMMGIYHEPVKVWTLRDWIIEENEVDALNVPKLVFPPAYSDTTRSDSSIISLTVPWYDEVTQQSYSAGTRFCLASIQTRHDYYDIALYDHRHKKSVETSIAKSYAIPGGFFTFEERRKMFVNLLFSWCSEEKLIPFVWGGSSVINFLGNNVELKKSQGGIVAMAWDCQDAARPFSGLDASGLVLRAAQICGIAYYCCNSRSITTMLSMVPFSEIEEGDILWAPGYCGVVASLAENNIIEAQGYARGYGAVHCIALNKRFADIETWKDFIFSCENRIPLKSLNSQGQCVAHIPQFKIYRLPH